MKNQKEANRIRDNQRRSRARRKDHVQDLESRLRHCQRKGAEATLEVQTAARKVVQENAQLRRLLRGHLGWNDDDINRTLSESYEPHLYENLPMSKPCQAPTPPRDFGTQYNQSEVQEEPLPERGPANPPDEMQRHNGMAMSTSQSQTSVDGYPTDSGLGLDDTTACETAASIIASMRAHCDLEEARVELGCQSNEHCRVKNTEIFQKMDA